VLVDLLIVLIILHKFNVIELYQQLVMIVYGLEEYVMLKVHSPQGLALHSREQRSNVNYIDWDARMMNTQPQQLLVNSIVPKKQLKIIVLHSPLVKHLMRHVQLF
jgi:hypothetical protein